MSADSSEEQEKAPRAVAGAALMQPAVTQALTRALFEEWARAGYGTLSLERVARRAGVGKAALYRRWPSKLAMVCDRLEQLDIALAEVPDTGSLLGDVRALLGSLRRLLRHGLVRRILPDLHAEMGRSSALSQAIRGRLQQTRRERGTAILKRAIERGEIGADTDIELANDAMAALIYWRLVVTGARASDDYLDQLALFLVRAIGKESDK